MQPHRNFKIQKRTMKLKFKLMHERIISIGKWNMKFINNYFIFYFIFLLINLKWFFLVSFFFWRKKNTWCYVWNSVEVSEWVHLPFKGLHWHEKSKKMILKLSLLCLAYLFWKSLFCSVITFNSCMQWVIALWL